MRTRCMVGLLMCAVAIVSAEENRGIKLVQAAKDAGVSGYDPNTMHAIVIGIDAYKKWPKLRSAEADARSVASTLHRYYAFQTNQISLLLNQHATRKNILTAFDVGGRLTERDNLVIYYAGHGWMDEMKNGYWIPVDAEEGAKYDYVSNNQVVGDYFKKYRVKHLLILVDSCFSGAMLRGSVLERDANWRLPAGFDKPSRLVMTSGDLQPVPDGSAGHSPFAERFLQYLRHGDQKAFGMQDLHGFIRKNVGTESICAPLATEKHMPGGELALCRLDEPLKDDPYEYDAIPPPPPSRDTFPPPPSSQSLGGLYIGTTPPGAFVTAGRFGVQNSPATFTDLPAGANVSVTVELDDYEPEKFTMTVPADTIGRKRVDLRKLKGQLVITGDPDEAVVTIGGRKVGETPFMQAMDVGRYAVRVEKNGYEPSELSVIVAANRKTTQTVNLARRRGPKPGDTMSADLGGGVKMEMVWIPVGEFDMGSNDYDDEKPVHRVKLTKGFWMGKYEVTQEQWERVMGKNPSHFSAAGGSAFGGKDARNPVEQVSWNDCQEFVRRLNASIQSGGFRLPTEAEWEYACRAGTDTRFYAGNADSDLENIAWYRSNSGSKTHSVGQKQRNAWGLYDMSGNVWEWCQDWYGIYLSGEVNDPTGPSSGSYRVLRGGSWTAIQRFAGRRSGTAALPRVRTTSSVCGLFVFAEG